MKRFSHHERNREFWEAKGNIPLWRIAEKIPCHEKTLISWLRIEVGKDKMLRILDALEQVKKNQ